jgi:hypothetical protein
MTTLVHKLFRIVFPEQPYDPLEDDRLVPMDFESLC